jgi:hypothetical protein
MQMLNFEGNSSIFCDWCLPQTSVRSEETLQHAQWRGGARWPPMDAVMTEGYGRRVGERLRIETVTRVLRSMTAILSLRAASPLQVISSACSTGSLA